MVPDDGTAEDRKIRNRRHAAVLAETGQIANLRRTPASAVIVVLADPRLGSSVGSAPARPKSKCPCFIALRLHLMVLH